jgi:hypothetical protein
MLEQARLIEPPRRTGLLSSEASVAERAMRFQFPVGWSSLFDPLESAGADTERFTAPAVTPLKVEVVNPGPSAPNPSTFNSTVQWEMVVPKMVRSNPRIAPAVEICAPAPALRSVATLTLEPDTETREAPVEFNADTATLYRRPVRRPGALPLASKIFLSSVLVAAVAIPVATRVYSPRTRATMDAAAQSGWVRERSAPAGSNESRQLVLYRPSLGARDCRFEFTWKPTDGALAWIFRAEDKDNYYAMTIRALRAAGPYPAFSVERFTVYRGVESPHATKMIIRPEKSGAVQIRMDLSGATFKLYLNGSVADTWSDKRLTAGGLGFLEQADQPAEATSVRMAFSPEGGD